MPFPTGEKATLQTIDLSNEAIVKLLTPYSNKNITAKQAKIGVAEQRRKYDNSVYIFKQILKEVNDPNGAFSIDGAGGFSKLKVNTVDLTEIDNQIELATTEEEKVTLIQQREELVKRGVKQAERLAEILQFYDDNGIIDIRNIIEEDGSSKTNSEIDSNLFESLIELIDDYNDYINSKSLSQEDKVLMAKNSVMDGMYQTSARPENLIESQTSVDETTKPFKDKSEEAASAKDLKTFTPGNVENKIRAIVINQVGKEGIGICAVGTKSFSAWTAYCNHLLNRGNSLQQKNILINNTANGLNAFGNIRTLANVHAKDLSTVVDEDVLRAVLQVNQDKDAIIDISALLSLATDNAKELCLGKLNAGTKTIGMYIYGLSVGIPFNTIATLLMSPMGLTLKELLEGNVFNKQQNGFNTISSALNYLMIGPSKIFSKIYSDGFRQKITNDLFESLNNRFGSLMSIPGKSIHDAIARLAHNTTINLMDKVNWTKTQYKDAQILKEYLAIINSETAKDQDKEIAKNNYKDALQHNQILDQIINYFYQVDTIYDPETAKIKELANKQAGGNPNVPLQLRMLETLAGGADEMKTFGSILSSNNGVKTKLGEAMTFMRKLRQLVSNRHQANYERRVREWYMEPIYNNTQEGVQKGKRKDSAGGELAYPQSQSNNKWDLDFIKFMTDDDYALKQIQSYEKEKHSVNILDVIYNVPHFKGYLTGVALDYAGKKSVSAKYRAIEQLGDEGIKLLKATTSKDIESIYNKVNDLVGDKIRRKWMISKGLTFTVEPGQYFFTKNQEMIPATEPTTMFLGTDEGDATFKLWMENYVFPKITRGYNYDGSISHTLNSNMFIGDLQQVTTDRTPLHVTTNMYTLGINMMPRDDNERAILNGYRNSFNKLYYNSTKVQNKYTYQQLLWLYNQIVTLGKPGQNNLTSIFDDFVVKDELVKDYYNYVNDYDENGSIVYGMDVTKNELIRWIAPIRSAYSSNLEFIYTQDPTDGLKMKLHRKNRPNNTTPSEEMYDEEDYTSEEDWAYTTESLPYAKADDVGAIPKYKRYFLRGITASNNVEIYQDSIVLSNTDALKVRVLRDGSTYSRVELTPISNERSVIVNIIRNLPIADMIGKIIAFELKRPLYAVTSLKDLPKAITDSIKERTYSEDNIGGIPEELALQLDQALQESISNTISEIEAQRWDKPGIDAFINQFSQEVNKVLAGQPVKQTKIYTPGGWDQIIDKDYLTNLIQGIRNNIICSA